MSLFTFPRVLSLLLLTTLAGCGVVPKKSEISIHDPQPKVQSDPSWPRVATQLIVQRPLASRILDGNRIVVRPQPGELQVYRGANWVQPAPDMLQTAIVRSLADSGKLNGVARRGAGIAGQYELALELHHFDADYSDNGLPMAKLEISAQLIRNDRNQIIAHQVFKSSAVIDGSNATEVAAAFENALGELTREISGWSLRTLQAQP
ncbi:ABC transporter [Lysobacteraceae bacterium NML120232]|nr:ABC transporter [Xanthomonadaceae bacterium NML08-0793]PJK11968.1 ABC transporter [Xanthomonadaceae bacterium NML120232]